MLKNKNIIMSFHTMEAPLASPHSSHSSHSPHRQCRKSEITRRTVSPFYFLERRKYPDIIENSIKCTNLNGKLIHNKLVIFNSTEEYNVVKLPIFDCKGTSYSFAIGVWKRRPDKTLNREFGFTLIRNYLENLKMSFTDDVEMVNYIDSVLQWDKIYIHTRGKNLNFSEFEQAGDGDDYSKCKGFGCGSVGAPP